MELPFFMADDVDFMSYLFGDGKYPCAKCKRDCVDNIACIQCSICNDWYHYVCASLSEKEFYYYYYFCSRPCEMFLFPFNSCSTDQLIKDEICQNVTLANEEISKSTKRKSDLVTSLPPPPKPRNSDNVNFNPFIDVNCSYLKPKDLNGSFFGDASSCFSIFHNNIRSAHKNLVNLEEFFRNCEAFPDIIGVTETKLNSNSPQPEIEGYKFENVDSMSSAGGVGVFIANKIDYTLREDLRLHLVDCEDIWIEIQIESSRSR